MRLQFGSPGQPRRFFRATKMVLARSHSRSLQLLCTVGGNQAKLDTVPNLQLAKGRGGEAGRAHQ